ncbi:MAG: class I SAM-dependent methyltransferase [Bacteroidota bacterium]
MNNFNFIAPFYDLCARIIFGSIIDRSQRYFIDQLPSEGHVLVLGGGTGKILEVISSQKVVFLDKSSTMIKYAKQRETSSSVVFLQEDFLSFEIHEQFDVIMSPFFLDCFNGENLRAALIKIRKSIKPSGKLIVTDFQRARNERLLNVMHWFFKFTAGLESTSLKDIHSIIMEMGLIQEKEVFF